MISEFESPPGGSEIEEQEIAPIVDQVDNESIVLDSEIRSTLADFNVRVEWLSNLMIERMNRLDKRSRTFEDEKQAGLYGAEVFEYLKERAEEYELSWDELDTLTAGGMMTDIGKTGPAGVSREVSELITDIYGEDAGRDQGVTPGTPLGRFIDEFIPGDFEEQMRLLHSAGLSGDTLMREFWDQHVFWTADILKGSVVPIDTKIAAISHHILEGNLPTGVHEDGSITAYGVERDLSEVDVLVMLLDKYDAQRRRAKKTHKGAIEWLQNYMKSTPTFYKLKPEIQSMITKYIFVLSEALKGVDSGKVIQ